MKIVSVMLRGLGVHMGPIAAGQQQASDKSSSPGDVASARKSQLVVNSDLVSFSIVADSVRSSIKVDLSAPIELVFEHNDQQHRQQRHSLGAYVSGQLETATSGGGKQPAYCVYWDATTR